MHTVDELSDSLAENSLEQHTKRLSELCYGLIAALTLVCVLFTFFVYFLIWRHRRALADSKMITIPGS